IRCMMAAFEYFDGLPQAALTDRMKSVFLDMDGKTPIWNPIFADFAACLGFAPRVCKARKPQTKGKVERSVGVIKDGFWPGVRFTDIDDLNQQARAWCDRLNQKVHRTTQCSKVSPTGSLRKTEQPLGHQVTPPRVEIRNLAEYDQLFSQEAPR